MRLIGPGKPVQNAHIKSLNGKFRDECLNVHWFLGVEDAREKIGLWREDYNTARPHTSLSGATPEEFAKAAALRSPTAPYAPRPGPIAPDSQNPWTEVEGKVSSRFMIGWASQDRITTNTLRPRGIDALRVGFVKQTCKNP